MTEHLTSGRKQGPVAVITLLFGLLLGFAGGTGVQVQVDPGAAQLTPGEPLRRSANLRSARSDDERPDRADFAALLPPPARSVTELYSLRPAAAPAPVHASVAPLDRHVPHQARAPPAA